MSSLFKKTLTDHWLKNCWLDPSGNPCPPDTPGATFIKHRRVPAGTPGAVTVKRKSKKWYTRLPGHDTDVPLSPNKTAAKKLLGELEEAGELGAAGIPHPKHKTTPLAVHVVDFEASLKGKGTPSYVHYVVSCIRRVIAGCNFHVVADLDEQAVEQFLLAQREGRPAALLDPAKEQYTKRELGNVLGVKASAVPSLVRRHRLDATGEGKARRYPKATAEALLALRAKGKSVKTTNDYLAAVKQFATWLVAKKRLAKNPLAKLSGGNVQLDRRHDRLPLTEGELRAVILAAKNSSTVFRGLAGQDRATLYATAAGTGFRASELASLTPLAFDLASDMPTATLAACNAKNGRQAVQPLSTELATMLTSYLAGKPASLPVWPSTWPARAADMLRVDLEAAGVPYAVEGPDGVRFRDFHSFRHTFISLLDKSGATLKEAMQLARHSDPKLTTKVYGRAQLNDLGEAVRRLPALVDGTGREGLRATGTDGNPDQNQHTGTETDPLGCTPGCTKRG